MKVGVPKEVKNHEYRVALTPIGAHELTQHGHEVYVEAGAGAGSLIPDEEYVAAGATMLGTADDVWGTADMVLKVKEPVAEEYADYLGEVVAQLVADGVRAELDHSDDRMQKKIRTHTTHKVPLMLIAGEQDRSAGTVSFRFRDGSQQNGVPIADAVRRIHEAIASRALVNTAEDFG